MSYDIVGVGEAMLRLWVPPGQRLETTPALQVSVGGAEANVAAAAARMGASTAWLSTLPDNPLGRRVAGEMAAHGVDVSHVRWIDGGRTGAYFLELSAPPRPATVIYDRAGSAASRMDSASIDWSVIETAGAVHLSGITPALSESCRELSFEIVRRARAGGALVSLDVNYRKALWPLDECRRVIGALAAESDLVIATLEDAREVFRLDGGLETMLDALAAATGAAHTVITTGADGAHWRSGAVSGHTPGYAEVVTVDRVGAGDAFAAGVLLGLLEGDLAAGVSRGLAMAALKMGIFGDQLTATPEDVGHLLAGEGKDIDR